MRQRLQGLVSFAGSKASRRSQVLAVAVALVLVLAGLLLLLRGPLEAVDPTWERILTTRLLRVCTDPSWPPFEFVDERSGAIAGLDVELAGLLAGKLAPGVRAEMVPVGFDSLYDALLASRCDAVLSALPYEAERTQDLAYSLAYFNAGLVLVTREDTTGIEAPQDLAGRLTGVEWGFVAEGDSRQKLLFRDVPLRRYDTALDALRALQSGEVEAALVDQISALAYTHDCRGLRLIGEPLTDVSYVIPVRLESWTLLAEINSVLIHMREDGTLQALQNKWF